MPLRTKKPCANSKIGCPNVVPGTDFQCSPCKKQGGTDYNKRRHPLALKFYGSVFWQKLRAKVRLEEPLCRLCDQPTEDIDHIHPINWTDQDAWQQAGTRANLQGLCKTCHSRKTRKENGLAIKTHSPSPY